MNADTLLKQGITSVGRGDHETAFDSFLRLLALDPQRPDLLNDCGAGFGLLGRHEEALSCFAKALSLNPGYVDALNNRGLALSQLGRHEEAVACLERVLVYEPDHLDALCTMGYSLNRLGRTEQALMHLQHALRLEPDHVGALDNQGLALLHQERHEEALHSFDRLLQLVPEHPGALARSAGALVELGHNAQALERIERLRRISPGGLDAAALVVEGLALSAVNRPHEALASFEAVLKHQPDHPEALANHGFALYALDRREEALQRLEQALVLAPGLEHVRFGRACAHLSLGNLAQGFDDMESRWEADDMQRQRAHLRADAPLWLGETPLAGRRILLWNEQGFGDSIQFARYASRVAAEGGRVILRVPPALQALMQTLQGPEQVVEEGVPLPDYDLHCPLLSLPRAFGTTLDSIPAAVPYLRADPALVARWAARLGPRRRPRIGLAWAGRQTPPIVPFRDAPLHSLLPLLQLDADFISLQKDVPESDRETLAALPRTLLLPHGEATADFADTAALIENLDLVISVDTAIAHLAGALDKPTWVLNRYAGCWRWLRGRSDSPWYPSLRLFRQQAFGDWQGVVEQVGAAIVERFRQPAAEMAVAAAAAAADPSTAAQASWVPQLAPEQATAIAEAAREGFAAYDQGAYAESLGCFERILAIDPDHAEALNNRGLVLEALGRLDEALASYTKVLRQDPHNINCLNNRALALSAAGRQREALADLELALTLNPDRIDTLNNHGLVLIALESCDQALQSLQRGLQLDPDDVDLLNNRALALGNLDRLDEALDCLEHVLRLAPDHVDALSNQGLTLTRLHRYDEAMRSLERALALAPQHAKALTARAVCLQHLNRHREALALFDAALALQPQAQEARYNRAFSCLALGDLPQGFAGLELRWVASPLKQWRPRTAAPPWRGDSPLQGKTLLIWGEQGLGDAIQFVRYVPLAAARGARVVLRAPAELHRLLAGLEGLGELVAPEAPLPPHDCYCPLMSLPLAFGTTLESIPAAPAYLRADAALAAQWAQRLGPRRRPRVGLAWAGNRATPVSALRDLPPAMLTPLFDVQADFISLQKDVSGQEREALTAARLLPLGETLEDFADTAALIENLDLVISVDTSVAHLAGALGKPVWLLNRFSPCWRWLQGREDSPWYPAMRLFGQPALGDWRSVVEQVRQHLAAFAAQ